MISVLLQRWRLSLRLAGNDVVPEHSYSQGQTAALILQVLLIQR